MLIFERSSLLGRALFWLLGGGGLAGLGGSWRAQICTRKWLSRDGRVFLLQGAFRKGFPFAGWEGLAFERGGGGWMLRHACGLWLAAWGSGMLEAREWLGLGHAWGWMLGRLGLGVACYLSFCRLVLFAKPTTFAIVKTKATPPRGACYGSNTNTHNHY